MAHVFGAGGRTPAEHQPLVKLLLRGRRRRAVPSPGISTALSLNLHPR